MKHTIRRHDGTGTVQVELTRARAIKYHCTECMGDDHPKDCTSPLCALYPYRGRAIAKPKRQGIAKRPIRSP